MTDSKDDLLDLLGDEAPSAAPGFVTEPAEDTFAVQDEEFVRDVVAPAVEPPAPPVVVTPKVETKKPWVNRMPSRGSRRKLPSDEPKAGGRRYYDPPKEA